MQKIIHNPFYVMMIIYTSNVDHFATWLNSVTSMLIAVINKHREYLVVIITTN